MDKDKDIDEVLDEIGDSDNGYDFELFLSTDGKCTVHVTADKETNSVVKKRAMVKCIEVFEYIKERFGTKQAQAVREYGKNGGDKKDPDECSHTNIKYAQSKTEKNPGRWFKSCRDCSKFLGWQD